jgi:uncharacterized protein (TIGR03083 family)
MDGTHVPAAGQRPPPLPDMARAVNAARGAAGQLVALLRTGPDPGLPAVGGWKVRDVAAHVAGGAELYEPMLRGTPSTAPSIEAITELNDQIVGTLGEQEIPALADRFAAAVDSFLGAAERHGAERDVTWHAGLHLPLPTLLAVATGEYLVHGHDIARAARVPWPVPADWARTVFMGLLPVVPHYLLAERARGRPARYDIRLRGERSARAIFTVADEALAIEAPAAGRRIDCHLSRPLGIPSRALRPERATQAGPDRSGPGLGAPAMARLHAAHPVPQALTALRGRQSVPIDRPAPVARLSTRIPNRYVNVWPRSTATTRRPTATALSASCPDRVLSSSTWSPARQAYPMRKSAATATFNAECASAILHGGVPRGIRSRSSRPNTAATPAPINPTPISHHAPSTSHGNSPGRVQVRMSKTSEDANAPAGNGTTNGWSGCPSGPLSADSLISFV